MSRGCDECGPLVGDSPDPVVGPIPKKSPRVVGGGRKLIKKKGGVTATAKATDKARRHMEDHWKKVIGQANDEFREQKKEFEDYLARLQKKDDEIREQKKNFEKYHARLQQKEFEDYIARLEKALLEKKSGMALFDV